MDVQDAILAATALDALAAWATGARNPEKPSDSRFFQVEFSDTTGPEWEVTLYHLDCERHPDSAEGTSHLARVGQHLPTLLTQVVLRDLPRIDPIPADSPGASA